MLFGHEEIWLVKLLLLQSTWMAENKAITYEKELVQLIFIQKFSLYGLVDRKETTKCIYFAIIKTRYQT